MKHVPHNMGKLAAIAACVVVALALLVVVASVSAAPTQQAGTGTPAASAATTAPTTTTAAATRAPVAAAASATPVPPPAADLRILAVPANAASKIAITTTIQMVTSTQTGPKKTTVALMTSGLPNVAISVPVKLQASPADPKWTGSKVQWSLITPGKSNAKLSVTNTMTTSFTPDLVGAYMVTAAFVNDAGTAGEVGAVQLHAGMYEGVDAGKCATCHPDKVAEWSKTGHAVIFSDMIDNKRTPDVPTHYSESCIRCHTTGYDPAPYGGAGGMKDAMTAAKWQFPTFAQIDAAGKKTGPSNWANAPAAVKNMGNIQCEVCHGPAKEHVETGARVMQSSQDKGVCYQCHNGGGIHLKGTELDNSKHSDATAVAWTEPTGPGEQACVRCHSGNGYASFLADPTNQAAWDNTPQTVVCSTCHDPHSEANAWQLRITDTPIALPFQAKDVGLSATCMECHNARNAAAAAAKGQTSFPHYSSAAEFLSDTGGVDYGKTIPNSPHGVLVGNAPVVNPAAKTDPEAPKFLFSKAGDNTGNKPGPCVTCHMYPTIEDQKDPNYRKVGSHSFNTVSPDGKFDYVAACQTCHTDIKDFNFKAKADYDGNGKTEGVQDEVKGLLDKTWAALVAKGVKKIDTGYPYATLPKGADGKVDPKIQNAWYNFRNVYGVMWGAETGNGNQGKAQAIHNFDRSVALLQASIKDLTGQDVQGATILYK